MQSPYKKESHRAGREEIGGMYDDYDSAGKEGEEHLVKRHWRVDKRYLSKEDIEQAIAGAMGNLTVAARSLNTQRKSLLNWIERDTSLMEFFYHVRQSRNDVAEDALFDRVLAGDTAAIKFHLSTQARDRGYGQVIDHNYNFNGLNVDQLDSAILALEAGESIDAVYENVVRSGGTPRSAEETETSETEIIDTETDETGNRERPVYVVSSDLPEY